VLPPSLSALHQSDWAALNYLCEKHNELQEHIANKKQYRQCMSTDAGTCEDSLDEAEAELQKLRHSAEQCIEIALQRLARPGFAGQVLYVRKEYRSSQHGNSLFRPFSTSSLTCSIVCRF